MTTPPPFDLSGPLPGPGITVLEASAGTGKTYALTSLVTRYVAAGVPLGEILAVTFTRMATGEIRDRVRERMVEVFAGLALPGPEAADPVVRALASGSGPEAGRHRSRLGDAVSEFDAATIATTHGFCQMVLRELGSSGDTALDATLLEDPSDLVGEVVDDLYLRWVLGRPMLPFPVRTARDAALWATRNPDVRVVPEEGGDGAALLARLARRARDEVARRLLDANQLTYDHLLFKLARTLADADRGPQACHRLRRRYRVVLVDEFQDTDPSQWEILKRAFGDGRTTLVLIGDPKQAIYGFRGADVYSYLDAARTAASRFTLGENWRADQPLLDATDALLSPLQFGHEGIPYRTVRAPASRQQPGLTGHPHPEPLRFRVIADRQPGVRLTTKNQMQKGSLVEWLADDLAADVAGLLGSGAVLRTADGAGRPLTSGDVAVLTRTNRQALTVREALRRAGVTSVVAGLDTVFASSAARDWLRLLEALQEPASRSHAAAAALTDFLGRSATDLAAADESDWELVHDRIHRWAAVLVTRGVAALYRTITVEENLPARVLGCEGGERALTDLGHVAQLLHAEASGGQLSAPALRAWLAERIAAASSEQEEAEERSRRLESDAEAVQVLTIHRAKGLEFPVVYCPFLWDPGKSEGRSAPVVFHDPDAGDTRTLDVGCPDADRDARRRYDRHADLAKAERRGEELRLLYVALTRARHQVVVWWAGAKDSRLSPLSRLLVCRNPFTGEVGDVPAREPGAKQVTGILEKIAALAPGLISVEAPSGSGRSFTGSMPSPDGAPRHSDLATAEFARSLDLRWRRASYTSITSAAHAPGRGETVGSEPEDPGLADEPDGPAGVETSNLRGEELDRPSPLGGLPGGAEMGTLVHRILERTDFAAADLAASLTAASREAASLGAPAVASDELQAGLAAAITTPLGPLVPGLALSDISRADRLDELSFELPVAGGDQPAGAVLTADIAALVEAHLAAAPSGSPLSGYAARLGDPALATSLRGYLTGSLDLVFRTGRGRDARWFLADYKTNWLGAFGRPLTLGSYVTAALDEEMQARHYPLQALFYMVALHRYLRWRQAGYEPERHLGGVLYLFVRGMAGPETPLVDGHPCGVFSWSPPTALVVGLSDLLRDGGGRP